MDSVILKKKKKKKKKAMALPDAAKDLVVRRMYDLDALPHAEVTGVQTPPGLSNHGASPAARHQEIAEGVYRCRSMAPTSTLFVRARRGRWSTPPGRVARAQA